VVAADKHAVPRRDRACRIEDRLERGARRGLHYEGACGAVDREKDRSWFAFRSDGAVGVKAEAGENGELGERLGVGQQQGLRENPAFGTSGAGERATAFFDIFGVPGARLENQAIAVLREAQDAGRKPVHALGYARLLSAYQVMFWNALAARAEGPMKPGRV
jgi:hypothetical protein